jgi:hypothetical protein
MLRIELAGTMPGDSRILHLVRSLKFTANQAGEADIQHGKESMGKQIMAAVCGVDALPETITLQVRVFDVPDLTKVFPVTCAFDIEPHTAVMRLVPLPMQCGTAADQALADAVQRIREAVGVPIYVGQP